MAFADSGARVVDAPASSELLLSREVKDGVTIAVGDLVNLSDAGGVVLALATTGTALHAHGVALNAAVGGTAVNEVAIALKALVRWTAPHGGAAGDAIYSEEGATGGQYTVTKPTTTGDVDWAVGACISLTEALISCYGAGEPAGICTVA